MSNSFFDSIRNRRSIYAISKESPVSDKRIQEILEEAIKHTPSAFNSQSTRIVLLVGAQHDKLWDMTTDVLRAIVPADNFETTQQRMNGFKNGYGTVLYFEDLTVVEELQKSFPLYQDNFPVWSQHTNAMHQLVIWTALADEGFGVSLQHYNPIIDERVKNAWSLPESWKLIAQMPFGKVASPAGEKQFKPVDERLKVFK